MATVQRFRVSAHDNGYYCVSIPKYEGGDVVDAADYDALLSEVVRLRETLTTIASFDDVPANAKLASDCSYVWFDEPGSVEIARAALAGKNR